MGEAGNSNGFGIAIGRSTREKFEQVHTNLTFRNPMLVIYIKWGTYTRKI